ncbi:MAG: addiction module protein [Bacteroidota bacterium]
MSVTNLVQALTTLKQEEQRLFLDSVVSYIKEKAILEEDLSPVWKAEINRRWKTIEDGTAQLVSLRDMQNRINKKYGINVNLP